MTKEELIEAIRETITDINNANAWNYDVLEKRAAEATTDALKRLANILSRESIND